MSHRVETATPLFHGWIVVAVCFVLQGLGSGTTTYLVGTLTVPLSEAFGASRGTTLFVTSTMMMMGGCAFGPCAGLLLQRYSIRWLAVLTLVWMAIGFTALAHHAGRLWHVAAVYLLSMAAGMSLMNILASTLAANWFIARRGRALGFTAAGTSAFGFVLPPLMTFWVAQFGWRTACLLVAALLLLAVPLVSWLVVDKPEMRGLRPDGVEPREAVEGLHAREASVSWSVPAMFRHSRFWAIVIAVSLTMGVASSLLVNFIPMAIDRGFGAGQAAWFLSLVAACAVAGKIGFGIVADYVQQRMMVWIPAALAAVACMSLMGSSSYAALLASSISLGLAFGAATPAWGTLVGATFGREAFGLAMGLMSPFIAATLAITVPFAGWVNDVRGSYDNAWGGFVGLLVLVGIAGLLLPGRRDVGVPDGVAVK
jgi:MFS family permease